MYFCGVPHLIVRWSKPKESGSAFAKPLYSIGLVSIATGSVAVPVPAIAVIPISVVAIIPIPMIAVVAVPVVTVIRGIVVAVDVYGRETMSLVKAAVGSTVSTANAVVAFAVMTVVAAIIFVIIVIEVVPGRYVPYEQDAAADGRRVCANGRFNITEPAYQTE